MEKFVDDALGLLQESMKAFSREVVNNTLRLLHSFSVLLLALVPAQTSSQLGIQDVNSMPRGPEVPSWMDNGVSSFNSFLQEEDIDSGSDLDEDDNISSDRRRGRSPLWRRCVRQLFTPLRVLTTGSKRAAKAKRLPRKLGSTGAGIGAAGVAESDGSAYVARSSSSERFNRIYSMAKSHLSGVKDYVMPKQAGDRRRGVIEDLQFLVELAIERAFKVLRNIICLMLSPVETVKLILWWFFLSDPTADDAQFVEGEGVILGDADPSFLKPYKGGPDLNTDGRTCGDVITSLGYPYEALRVTTEDGHILLLERIPRANSQKVLYLQHGLLDSSLGWVSNGVVGSQAFAAYDQGYDVFLGNFRGSASRDHHVNPNISTRSYWNYSVNEHGAQDIPAMLEKIHEIKMEDLKATIRDNESAEGRHGSDCSTSGGESEPHMPYALCGVAHSLGGASILMYVVLRKLESKPHRLSRLILLSPAGFHEQIPWICKPLQYIFPVISPLASLLVPGLYIPTRIGRGLFNKLARDLESYPAIRGLLQLLLSLAVGGDSSNWVGALGISHYNMDDMPGTSFKVTQHLLQMARSKRFCMFDFGSVRANIAAYGIPEPLDIGAHYEVIDIPVDVVAGVKDYVIPRSMVRKHFDTLKKARCDASYDEFEYAHLDFTFAHREELLAYVMSRLLLVKPPSRPPSTLSTSDLPVASLDEAPDATYSGFKAKSFKRKLNSLLLSRKPRSRKGAGLLREKSMGITPVSSPVNEISEGSSADQDVLVLGHDSEMVSAGSVATDKHEESFRESRTPPLTEDGLGVASTKELQDRLNCPQSMTESLYQDDSPKCTESHPKREKNSVSELQSRRNPRGGQRLLSNNRPRSITGLILWTLSNCYSRPTMQVEDSDE